jgi:hypothetical protein
MRRGKCNNRPDSSNGLNTGIGRGGEGGLASLAAGGIPRAADAQAAQI